MVDLQLPKETKSLKQIQQDFVKSLKPVINLVPTAALQEISDTVFLDSIKLAAEAAKNILVLHSEEVPPLILGATDSYLKTIFYSESPTEDLRTCLINTIATAMILLDLSDQNALVDSIGKILFKASQGETACH